MTVASCNEGTAFIKLYQGQIQTRDRSAGTQSKGTEEWDCGCGRREDYDAIYDVEDCLIWVFGNPIQECLHSSHRVCCLRLTFYDISVFGYGKYLERMAAGKCSTADFCSGGCLQG